MSVKNFTNRMIAHLKVAVNIPNNSQLIPNLESPGNCLASDSILSFLVRLEVPGLSSFSPLMAASIVDTLMPGAASSLFSERS